MLWFSSTAGSVHPPSTSMATSSQYRQLLSDYGPPSLGYTQVQPWAGIGGLWGWSGHGGDMLLTLQGGERAGENNQGVEVMG